MRLPRRTQSPFLVNKTVFLPGILHKLILRLISMMDFLDWICAVMNNRHFIAIVVPKGSEPIWVQIPPGPLFYSGFSVNWVFRVATCCRVLFLLLWVAVWCVWLSCAVLIFGCVFEGYFVCCGSHLGVLRLLKCLSKDTIASAFKESAAEYWMASSMSSFC